MSIDKTLLKEKTIKSDKMHPKFNCSATLGFTLAEVLVTLGIIGVVSAMTIPTLVKNHQRQVYVTQLQKVYNELSQALEQVITDSNAVNLRESSFGRNGTANFLRAYFKTVKTCTPSAMDECFAEDYKNMNGDDVRIRDFIFGTANCAVIASGAAICIDNSYHSQVFMDVNGKQGPNIIGRDVFDFRLYNDGTIAVERVGGIDYHVENFNNLCVKQKEFDYGACVAKIINDGWKMDY